MPRIVPLIIASIIFAVFFIALFRGNPQTLPSTLIGKPAPQFTTPQLFTTSDFTNKDLRQDKITLLNVWASWCVPCRTEHPHLMALKERGIPVFGLNYKDDDEAAKRFIKTRGNPFQKIGIDKNGSTAFLFGVYGIPETFIINSNGKILARLVGEISEERIKLEINKTQIKLD